MYAIENDLGRFEADSEKGAKKLLRKAQAEARKESARLAELSKQADAQAEGSAYRFYSRFLAREECPRAWILYREPGSYGFKHARTYRATDPLAHWLEVDTPEGKARIDLWRIHLTGVVLDGAGWPVILELQHEDGTPAALYTIGTAGDLLALAQLHGIPADWFRTSANE